MGVAVILRREKVKDAEHLRRIRGSVNGAGEQVKNVAGAQRRIIKLQGLWLRVLDERDAIRLLAEFLETGRRVRDSYETRLCQHTTPANASFANARPSGVSKLASSHMVSGDAAVRRYQRRVRESRRCNTPDLSSTRPLKVMPNLRRERISGKFTTRRACALVFELGKMYSFRLALDVGKS